MSISVRQKSVHLRNALSECGVPLLLIFIVDHVYNGLTAADDDNAFLGTCDRCLEYVSVEQLGRPRQKREHDSRILAAL